MQDATDLYRPPLNRLSRLWRLAVMVGIGFALAFLVDRSGMVETLDWATYDLSFQLRGERAADAPIVIVAINDESFTSSGRTFAPGPARNMHA